ncbi:hypothetical protein DdX_14868 [Ditylenchus destructor]|uniref:F-box domain-containing protein n=1 Tax=Ditylenchus destructor TaxID=166010 RepID=A0AAD4R1K4_9BILA|nr:hypothetical protein DdX_14868 [Ditylenchus destructor]
MSRNRLDLSLRTIVDIFALFNRKELFELSLACHRFNVIVEKHFRDAPYLIFYELVRDSCWKWRLWEETGYTNMPIGLVTLLKSAKFIRFQNTHLNWRTEVKPLINELESLKHIFNGQTLWIAPGKHGYTTETIKLISKCRHLKAMQILYSNAATVIPQLLSNNHDQIELRMSFTIQIPVVLSMPLQIVLPVADFADFLFRPTGSNAPYKRLIVFTCETLEKENRTQIVEAIKLRFLDNKTYMRFEFKLSAFGVFNAGETTMCNNAIGQKLEIIVCDAPFSIVANVF